MTDTKIPGRRPDWTGSIPAYMLGWGLPLAAIAGGLLVDAGLRAAVWTAALLWMGSACILNARRCGRVHCRYTGPFYWLMIVPVIAAAMLPAVVGNTGWLLLAAVIVFGSRIIWWASERAWGQYR